MSELATARVQDVLSAPKDVVMLTTKATVLEALETFEQYKITSCPVLDDSNNQCIGFVDVLDCVAHLVHTTGGNSAVLKWEDLHHIWQQNGRFSLQTVNKIMDKSLRDPFLAATRETPLRDVIYTFAQGIHRVAVADETGKLVDILTQSSLIKYLAQNPKLLGDIAEKTPLDLNIGGNADSIVKVYDNETTIDAFRKLFDRSVSAIAIVDENGAIVSQLSSSDLREITHTLKAPLNIRALLKPVKEYIEICRTTLGNSKSFLVWALPGTKIIDLVKLMDNSKVHRVWLIDNYTKLYGVFSMTDVMKLLLLQMQK